MQNALVFLLTCLSWPLAAQIAPCAPLGPNLVLNPGFELGYFGFSSDFGRGLNNATRCDCNTQGWILVSTINPHAGFSCQGYPADWSAQYGGPNTFTHPDPAHPSNTSVATIAVCNAPVPDHTTGNGLFLTVDPDACPDRAYWRQPLQVCRNTPYYFSVWVRNLAGLPAPTFHFEVDGLPVTNVTSYPENDWVQTSVQWYSGNVDGNVWLELVNDLPGCDANDVAIDDLFFGVCAGITLSSGSFFQYCPDDPAVSIQFSGSSTGFVHPQYQWQRRNGNVWINLPGETDTLLVIHQPGSSDAGLYRLISTEDGNIASLTCAAISETIELAPYPAYDVIDTVRICEGESYAGYQVSGLYTRAFQTTNGCDSIRTLDLRVRSDLKWFVPNVFSPDGDGFNDEIAPQLSDQDIDRFCWQVFDRWGGLVFESRRPGSTWNGDFRGKPCQPGVYIYSLLMEIEGCQLSQWQGDIMLLR